MTEETKRISDLQLKAAGPDASDDFVVDTGTLTQRVTGQQVLDFIAVNGKVPAHNLLVSYSLNDFVVSGGVFYKSLANANVGNALTDVTKWVPVSRESNSFSTRDNYSILCTVSSNSMTICLKTQDGGDPTALDFVTLGFRNTSGGSGSFDLITAKAAVTTSLSSGSTLGLVNAASEYIYVYAINYGGAIELMVTARRYHTEEGNNGFVTTVAEGGAGTADARTLAYSTTQRTNVPFVLLGRLSLSLATAGVYDEIPDIISLAPLAETVISARAARATTSLAYTTITDVIFSQKLTDTSNIYNPSNGAFSAPETGWYLIEAQIGLAFGSPDVYSIALGLLIEKNDDTYIAGFYGDSNTYAGRYTAKISGTFYLVAGEYIKIRASNGSDTSTVALSGSSDYSEMACFTRVR